MILFVLYQPLAHPNQSICGTADWSCIESVDQEIMIKENPLYKCDHCLNGCFSINYDPSFSTAKIFDKVPILHKNGLEPKNVGIVHIYYSRSTFRSRRIEVCTSEILLFQLNTIKKNDKYVNFCSLCMDSPSFYVRCFYFSEILWNFFSILHSI